MHLFCQQNPCTSFRENNEDESKNNPVGFFFPPRYVGRLFTVVTVALRRPGRGDETIKKNPTQNYNIKLSILISPFVDGVIRRRFASMRGG